MKRYVGLEALRGARVLELGGANSRFLVDLASHVGADVTAVDYSEIGVAQTRELFRRSGVAGHACLGDIFRWDGGGQLFDAVTHWGLVEHFDDPVPVLGVSARLVKPGGLVIFTMPNLDSWGARVWARTAPANFGKHVYHSDATIHAALDAVGLVLETAFYTGPPLVRVAPPERRGVLAAAANGLHGLLCTVGTLAPGVYTSGRRRVANTRGFIARRVR